MTHKCLSVRFFSVSHENIKRKYEGNLLSPVFPFDSKLFKFDAVSRGYSHFQFKTAAGAAENLAFHDIVLDFYFRVAIGAFSFLQYLHLFG